MKCGTTPFPERAGICRAGHKIINWCSMKPPRMYQVGIFNWRRVCARTHEWAHGQRVSLLDAHVGQTVLRVLKAEELELADAFMAVESERIADLLVEHGVFAPRKRGLALRRVEQWKRTLVRLWREQVHEPIPASWRWTEERDDQDQERRESQNLNKLYGAD